MKRFVIAAAALLGGCLQPVTAETAHVSLERCTGEGALEYRVAQCSTVINFPETTPEDRAAALIARGRIRADQSQFARAMTDYGRAMRINNRNAQAYLARAALHQMRGAYNFALRDFDQALAIDPTLEAAITGRNDTLANRVTQYREQLEAVSEDLKAAPTNAALLNERCWIRTINDDDLDAALADCNAALLAEPRNSAALDSRGLVHLKRGDYAASIADYEAALAVEPTRGHYMFGRGVARIRMGLVAEGQADVAEAERLEPGITANYRTYGVAL